MKFKYLLYFEISKIIIAILNIIFLADKYPILSIIISTVSLGTSVAVAVAVAVGAVAVAVAAAVAGDVGAATVATVAAVAAAVAVWQYDVQRKKKT